MISKVQQGKWYNCTSISAIICGLVGSTVAPAIADTGDVNTVTPIKHVIVIVGENRTFDHLFGAYKPRHGQTVSNLLSKGIINADGTPGRRFGAATQYQASNTSTYLLNPLNQTPYATLPPPALGGAQSASDTNPPPFQTLATAQAVNPYLLPQDIVRLTTGATGVKSGSIDTRIPNVNNLLSGPFQLTPGVPYDAYAASPIHRFYQMWQQTDCDISHATKANPSGCLNALFPWVEVTAGDSNGNPPPAGGFTGNEGATAMGFYNVNNGDMPYFKSLADNYAISDNYHQPVMGGTGANSIMIGVGDALWYGDGNGNPATPPQKQIENPNPQPGTNNFYTQDGYSGGTYSNCSDPSQPGVRPILNYLNSLPYHPAPNCAANTYYLLNNYDPGYLGDGTVDTSTNSGFIIPPSPVRNIGDALLEKNISWRYYGEGWNQYVQNPNSDANVYCNICNPFQYSTSIMTNAQVRTEHLKDTTDLDNDISNETLPAVSFVKPGGLLDGHPASSKFDLFEAFTKKVISEVRSHPNIWKDTAILVTVDEGGGYWDSGYIQPLDFFGDGTRIPLIVVSPYSQGGRVVHTYYDHVSILKFIEKNWGLSPLTDRSRDRLPNPVTTSTNPYLPVNGPAIGDLMEMFHF